MKSRIWSAILLVSSAAACATAAPQSAPSPRSAEFGAEVPPILSLLSEREHLSLTPAQVVALESIAREWDVANEKLSRRLRLARGTRPLPAVAALRPQGSYTRDALAANHRRAALAVEQVLTPAQRTAACDMERASGPRDRALTRASGARHTSTRPLWPWCGATTPARTLAAVTGGAD